MRPISSIETLHSTTVDVLAVLVVFERPLAEVESWLTLRQLLEDADSPPTNSLRLTHLLIYDNSATPVARPAETLTGCTYRHDPGNGGTAAAYREAVRLSATVGARWLLLVDHDTDIPPSLFIAANTAFARSSGAAAALLPWVMHGASIISPARLTATGSVRALVRGAAVSPDWRLTGVASGSFLRAEALACLDRMPRGLWLDYVDHWIFAALAARKAHIALVDCVLRHDLSVARPERLSNTRLRGLLQAEQMFVATLPWPARAAHPWRLAWRARRMAMARPDHAWAILKHAFGLKPQRQKDVGVPIQAVSVVMAVYNGERFLARQMLSVLAQLRPVDEVLVVDDASTDGSVDWLRRLEDPRVRIVHHSTNLGVRRSFEDGLRQAVHDIVFLCDQDDVWLPGKRDAVVAEFEADPGALIVISDAEVIDADDHILAASFMATRGGFKGCLRHTLIRNRYLGCAMAMRRDLIDAALPIPETAPMHDMWLGVLGSALGRVRYIERPLIQYRRHGANVSPSTRQPWSRMLLWRVALFANAGKRLTRIGLGVHRSYEAP